MGPLVDIKMRNDPAIIILVVEDEPFVRMDISETLAAAGYVVLEAGNADEAIRMLEGHPEIQAMFTYVDMPGSMNGLKLATAVRDRWPPVDVSPTSHSPRMFRLTTRSARQKNKPCIYLRA